MSIYKRVKQGIFAGGSGFVVNLMQAVVQVPVLLHYWGAEKMGIWLSLIAAGVLMTALDVGHHAYLGNKLNRLYATDLDEFGRTLGSGVRISLLIGFLPLLFILFGYCFFDLGGLLSVSGLVMSSREIALLLMVQMIQWSYTFALGGVLGQLYVAKGDFPRYTYWGACYRLLGSLILIISVFIGVDVSGAVLIQAAFCVLYHLVQWGDLRRRYPEFYPWWKMGSFAEGWLNYKRSTVLTFNNVGQQLLSQGLVLLVAKVLGSTAVPLYSATRTMVNVAQTANNIVINPLTPEIGRLDAAGNHMEVQHLLRLAVVGTCLLILLGIALAIWLVEPLFMVWTRGRLEFQSTFVFLLITAMALRMLGSTSMAYLISVNDLSGQSKATWFNAVIVFGGGALLMGAWGLSGLGGAMVIGELIGSLILPFRAVRERLSVQFCVSVEKLTSWVILSAFVVILLGVNLVLLNQYPAVLKVISVVVIVGVIFVFLKNKYCLAGLRKPASR